jgi:hypothetical protein
MTDSNDKYTFATELMIQVVCFYVGVILFLGICLIPPLFMILPYALPVVFIVCIVMNIGFVIKFAKGTQKELNTTMSQLDDHIQINGASI